MKSNKKKKYDVLVVGELNVDIILNQLDAMPVVGKEILAQKMDVSLGSSSAIFASNISSMGAKVAFSGMLGNDMFGNFILEKLKEKSIDTQYISISDNYKTGATIVLNQGEDRAMVTHQGAMAHFGVDDVSDDLLCNSRHLHVSSIFLQPNILKGINYLFARAKVCGMTTSLDMQWDPSEKWDINLQTLLPFVDVFLPNEAELFAVTKSKDINVALEQIQDAVKLMALKQGSKGSTAFFDQTTIQQKAFENKNVIDAIGAGDSFNAGFIFKYLEKASIKKCLEYGNLMGALNTTASGGSTAFINPKEIKNNIKNKFGIEI